MHSCLRYLVYRVSAAFDTCIRINQRTKRLGATMQIDLGNKLFPCLRACPWRYKLACGSHKHRNRAGGQGRANLVVCTQPCDAPCGHMLWAVLILVSLRVWQTFGSHCTRMSQSSVLQRAFDLSRAPLCGARLGNSSAVKACARQLACLSLCYSPAPLALRHYSFDIGGVASADKRALRQSHWAGVYRGAVAWY